MLFRTFVLDIAEGREAAGKQEESHDAIKTQRPFRQSLYSLVLQDWMPNASCSVYVQSIPPLKLRCACIIFAV